MRCRLRTNAWPGRNVTLGLAAMLLWPAFTSLSYC